MEERVETVNGAVDTDRDGLLVHFVEEYGQTGRDQVRRSPGHALADVPHVGAVHQGRVVDAHFVQNFQRLPVVGFITIRTQENTSAY